MRDAALAGAELTKGTGGWIMRRSPKWQQTGYPTLVGRPGQYGGAGGEERTGVGSWRR